MTILAFIGISYLLLSVSLYFLFPKADVPGWKGLVPGLNFVEWCSIIGRPKWHAAYLLLPIINLFVFCYMAVEMVRSFGLYRFKHTAIAVVYAPAIFFYIAFQKSYKFIEPAYTQEKAYQERLKALINAGDDRGIQKLQSRNPYKKGGMRQWVESLFFAVFAAAFIRMFLIEAYVIPTPSMEGSLLVGDYLFVSKIHFGMRTPMTVLQVPLLHNRIPVLNRESYISSPSLPYFRLPIITRIKNNDPFVFNWPVGDSVYLTPQRSYTIGQARRNPMVAAQTKGLDLIIRPIDKKDHYIKRCIAISGDTLQIIDRQVFINGKKAVNPKGMQFVYQITSSKTRLNLKKLDEWGVNISEGAPKRGFLYMTPAQAEKVKSLGPDVTVRVIPQRNHELFPHDKVNFNEWDVDNYGPIWIPKAHVTVPISRSNLALYKRIISVYEHNNLEIKGNEIWINGVKADTYTFKQNYYWAMGDNRHNSEDSRAWGFVPADHIVGKPLFIFFSTKNGQMSKGIHWNRIFTSAQKM